MRHLYRWRAQTHLDRELIKYRPQTKLREVKFSQVSVCPQVGVRGCRGEACVAVGMCDWGCAWLRDVHGLGDMCVWGACIAGGMCSWGMPKGGSVPGWGWWCAWLEPCTRNPLISVGKRAVRIPLEWLLVLKAFAFIFSFVTTPHVSVMDVCP